MGNKPEDNLNFEISERLLIERKRLGLQQDDARKTLDVAYSTMSRYENGHRSPDMVMARKLHDIGYDIGYVITGKRLSETASDLTDDEVKWLELYRQSKRRDELVRLVKAYESME